MSEATLILAWFMPLLIAPMATGKQGAWLLALAPLPALAVAMALPIDTTVTLSWLLLGAELGLDNTGRAFLLLTSILWLMAAVYAQQTLRDDPAAGRFRVFFLFAMAGNLLLIVAHDMASFFLGFALMSLSAAGLVAHNNSITARSAGRVYLAWTIVGEVALFSAVILLAAQSGSLGFGFDVMRNIAPSNTAIALLVLGFGIKLALPGLHVWLPLAYAAAPAPAAAVLSGAMINAGLLGWLRFLPPGNDVLMPWGNALVVVGLFASFYGVAIGLVQRTPKAVLGYSSISKMGVLTAGMGASLATPHAAPAIIAALTLYAAHHGLSKGALFLGVDLLEKGHVKPWVLVGLSCLALAIAGAPLTSGAIAKATLVTALPEQWTWMVGLLTAAAVATTLLMGRFLFLAWNTTRTVEHSAAGMSLVIWLVLVGMVLLFPFVFGDIQTALTGLLPVLVGGLLAVSILVMRPRMLVNLVGRIPPGDVLLFMEWLKQHKQHLSRLKPPSRTIVTAAQDLMTRTQQKIQQVLNSQLSPDKLLSRWPVAGALWLTVGGILLVTLIIV